MENQDSKSGFCAPTLDADHSTAAESPAVRPFRTISLMVNANCNLRCHHCDLPRRYAQYGEALSADDWELLLERVIESANPEVLAISAMEPLLRDGSQAKTSRALQVGHRHGLVVGFVTNGMFANEFFSSPLATRVDFLDISFDGPPAVNDQIRGPQHRPAVEAFLASPLAKEFADRIYISTTLNNWNSNEDAIRNHIEWVRQFVNPPRLVLLPINPNQHVDSRLPLAQDSLDRVLDLLVTESARCEEMFLDVFPSSLPDLANLIGSGRLPGSSAILQDFTGMMWGHVGENLFVRYSNSYLLRRYNLRISPEGHALFPEALESSNYLEGSMGALTGDSFNTVLRRLESQASFGLFDTPSACQAKPCLPMCAGENRRCAILRGGLTA